MPSVSIGYCEPTLLVKRKSSKNISSYPASSRCTFFGSNILSLPMMSTGLGLGDDFVIAAED